MGLLLISSADKPLVVPKSGNSVNSFIDQIIVIRNINIVFFVILDYVL